MAELKKFLFDNFTIQVPKKEVVLQAVVNDDIQQEVDIKPIEPNFNQKEVDEKIKAEAQVAFQKGFDEAMQSIKDKETNLFDNINKQLEGLLKKDDSQEKEFAKNVSKMGNLMLEKIIPSIAKKEANNIIENFLVKNFDNFKFEKKLSLHINSQNVSSVSQMMSNLANKNDFEGKISIVKDDALSVLDCKVEWDYGGVALNTSQSIEEVKEIIKA